MAQAITAIYENGIFIPQEAVRLPEHAKVKIMLPSHSKKTAPQRFTALIDEPLLAERLEIPTRDQRHER